MQKKTVLGSIVMIPENEPFSISVAVEGRGRVNNYDYREEYLTINFQAKGVQLDKSIYLARQTGGGVTINSENQALFRRVTNGLTEQERAKICEILLERYEQGNMHTDGLVTAVCELLGVREGA